MIPDRDLIGLEVALVPVLYQLKNDGVHWNIVALEGERRVQAAAQVHSAELVNASMATVLPRVRVVAMGILAAFDDHVRVPHSQALELRRGRTQFTVRNGRVAVKEAERLMAVGNRLWVAGRLTQTTVTRSSR